MSETILDRIYRRQSEFRAAHPEFEEIASSDCGCDECELERARWQQAVRDWSEATPDLGPSPAIAAEPPRPARVIPPAPPIATVPTTQPGFGWADDPAVRSPRRTAKERRNGIFG